MVHNIFQKIIYKQEYHEKIRITRNILLFFKRKKIDKKCLTWHNYNTWQGSVGFTTTAKSTSLNTEVLFLLS
jgi:hypothetical protein